MKIIGRGFNSPHLHHEPLEDSGSWRSHECEAPSGECPAPEAVSADWYRAIKDKNNHVPITFHYVYVLRSHKDGLLYVGYSSDLRTRIKDHNEGKNLSTKNRRPLELIYYEAFPDKFDALRRERYFKTTKGKVTLRQMLREFFL